MKRIQIFYFFLLITSVISSQSIKPWGKYTVKKTTNKHSYKFEYLSHPIIVEKIAQDKYLAYIENGIIKVEFDAEQLTSVYVEKVLAGGGFLQKKQTELRKLKPLYIYKNSRFENVLYAFYEILEYGMRHWDEDGYYTKDQKEVYGLIFYDDQIYRGKVINGLAEGKGISYVDNGTKIKCNFKDGKLEGRAVISTPDQFIIGNYINGKREGEFRVKFEKSGNKIKVYYKNGKRMGGSNTQNSVVSLGTGNFEDDIKYLTKKYRKNGVLVAGPLSERERRNGTFMPIVSGYLTKQLRSNTTYIALIVVNRKKVECREIKVNYSRYYGVGSESNLDSNPSLTIKPKNIDKRVSTNHYTYFFTFDTGRNFKSAGIIAMSKCKGSNIAKLFILKK